MNFELTLQAMLDELGVIVEADIRRLSAIFGGDAIRSLQATTVEDMPVTEHMRVLFDYVVNSRLMRSFPLDDALHELTDYFLETVPKSPMIDLHRSKPIEGICSWIVENAVVRWGLDFEQVGAFTIKQLATLANMDERSVRNAANPKNTTPLITFRDVDGNTMVARADVITWLQGRRSYKPTTFIDESGERDLEHDGFRDLFDLGVFIKQECEKQGKSLGKLLGEAGLEREYADWLAGKGSDHPAFDVDRFRRLAKALGKDDYSFTVAACKTFQKAELAWLESKLRD